MFYVHAIIQINKVMGPYNLFGPSTHVQSQQGNTPGLFHLIRWIFTVHTFTLILIDFDKITILDVEYLRSHLPGSCTKHIARLLLRKQEPSFPPNCMNNFIYRI